MNNVVVMFLDGKEVFIENATFTLDGKTKTVVIGEKTSETLIAVFNFDNIAGVRTI